MKTMLKQIRTMTMSFILLAGSTALAQDTIKKLEPPLKLDGPRMGFLAYTGENSARMERSKNKGGCGAVPLMYQFGYQFEKQYVGGGNLQGLFEFLPLITGLDQGLFIPSLTFMHGLRDSKSGWEFAFGPSVSIVKKADVYKKNGDWYLSNESVKMDSTIIIENKIDSRGELAFSTSFVFALGKTFRSGLLNIPVNIYVIPNKEGFMFGASVGFNARKK